MEILTKCHYYGAKFYGMIRLWCYILPRAGIPMTILNNQKNSIIPINIPDPQISTKFGSIFCNSQTLLVCTVVFKNLLKIARF